jgi:hypothetical protein
MPCAKGPPAAPADVAAARAITDQTDAARFAAWVTDMRDTLRARLWWVAAGVGVFLLLAVVYLRTTDYTYTATFRVVPAPGSTRESSNLGALTTLATLTGATLETIPVTPFRLYLEGIYTRQIAARLARDPAVMRHVFADEWDASAGAWREPSGLGPSLGKLVDRLTGQRTAAWTAPDAARLQAWINTNIKIDQTPKTPVVTLLVNDTDPQFARDFLIRLHQGVDEWVRDRSLKRTAANIAYLDRRLPGIVQADHREAIIATLGDQQQRTMTARNPAPFAAEPFGTVVVSEKPTAPRQLPMLILAMLFGAIITAALAIIIPRRGQATR